MTAPFSAGTIIDVSVDIGGNPQHTARIKSNLRDFISQEIDARMKQLQCTISVGERRGSQQFTDELWGDGRQFIGMSQEGLQFWATCPSQDSWLDLQPDRAPDRLADAFKKEFVTDKFLRKFNFRPEEIALSIEQRQSNKQEMKEALGKNSGDRACGQCSIFPTDGAVCWHFHRFIWPGTVIRQRVTRLTTFPYSKSVTLTPYFWCDDFTQAMRDKRDSSSKRSMSECL